MRRLLTLALILGGLTMSGQQLPQFSQYFMNDYALNPAVAGLRDKIEIRSNNRYQWEGITDAPRTYNLSFHVPLADDAFGLGAYLFTDIVGPTRRVGFQAGGAYRLPLSDRLELGVGFSIGMLEYSIDGDKIQLADEGDQALLTLLGSTRVMDAKVGLFLNAENYYLGFSVPQVAQNNLDIYSSSIAGSSTLSTHYYFTGGYRYKLNDDYTIEPNVLLKYVDPTPMKIDFSVRGIYKDMLWLGASYRNNDAVVAMIGLIFKERIIVGYSHDFSTSDIRNYSTGTHEVMFGLDIPKPE